jgi:hypothetical protein
MGSRPTWMTPHFFSAFLGEKGVFLGKISRRRVEKRLDLVEIFLDFFETKERFVKFCLILV